MKANELRIGNLVNHNDLGIFEIDGINPHCGDFKIETKSRWVYFKNCKPIPLTEEWLLKFGFEKIGVNFQKESISIWYSSYAKCYQLRYCLIGSDVERIINIEYLHQLQNLYFELSGIELSI